MDKSLSDLTVQVGKCIEDLGSRIENLLSNQTGLQMDVDSIQSQPSQPILAGISVRPSSAATSASTASSTAHNIIDELADRDKRKKNIIVYNLPEPSDRAANKVSFLALYKTVFDQDASVIRATRLGRRLENKHRPLLVCFEHEDDKITVISRSNLLRQHDQYKRVFLAPDRTKFEREKHAKLVNELKERKTKGETNLIIRNGSIVSRPTHPANNQSSQSSNHSSQSS